MSPQGVRAARARHVAGNGQAGCTSLTSRRTGRGYGLAHGTDLHAQEPAPGAERRVPVPPKAHIGRDIYGWRPHSHVAGAAWRSSTLPSATSMWAGAWLLSSDRVRDAGQHRPVPCWERGLHQWPDECAGSDAPGARRLRKPVHPARPPGGQDVLRPGQVVRFRWLRSAPDAAAGLPSLIHWPRRAREKSSSRTTNAAPRSPMVSIFEDPTTADRGWRGAATACERAPGSLPTDEGRRTDHPDLHTANRRSQAA
jgi:hypothetical protein